MHDDDHGNQPLLISDAARILKLAERSVRLLEATGQLRAERTPSGLRIFRRGEVERLAAARIQRREATRS